MGTNEQLLRFQGDSRHLQMASVISMVIAHAKQQTQIELRDMIAGIYVANFERILSFWTDAAAFEDFIAEHCDWSEPRMMTWSRWLVVKPRPPRTIPISFTTRFLTLYSKGSFVEKHFTESDELERVYSAAISLSRNKFKSFGQVVPLITPELFLFATIRTEGIQLRERLRMAGLRLKALEEAATRQLVSPEKMQ
jgi:hypothetical protein